MKQKHSSEKERKRERRRRKESSFTSESPGVVLLSAYKKKKINFVLEQVAARRRWRHRKIIRPFYISLRYRVYT